MPSEPVDDYRVLAAVAHPVRRRLLDVLRVERAMTASALADRLGVAVGSASHHAKVLAEHGLVVPAPELANDRRERWWRLGDARISWSTHAFADDPAGAAASSAADDLGARLQLERWQTWRAERASAPEKWQDAATSTDVWLHLTPDELGELSEELTAVLQRWAGRARNDDGSAGRRPVFAFAHAFPAQP